MCWPGRSLPEQQINLEQLFPGETIKTSHLSKRQKTIQLGVHDENMREGAAGSSNYFHLIEIPSASICCIESINMFSTQMYPDSDESTEIPTQDFIHFKTFPLVVKILDSI